MNHAIVLGCMQVLPDIYHTDDSWINIKRAAGAHKIASFMRSQGWDVEVLDYWLAFDFDEFKEFIESRVTADTKFIGVSATFRHYGEPMMRAQKYLRWIKETYSDITLIAGSKQLYVTADLPVDYHMVGYGEYGLLELSNKIVGKSSKVVVSETNGKKVVYCDTHHPCFPQKNLTVSYQDNDFLKPSEVLTLEFSRGCKFACKFCSYNVIGVKGDYTRDMPSLYEELMTNYDRFGIQDYTIADETVNDSVDKLKAIANQVMKLPFKPNMAGYIRGDLIASRKDDKKYLSDMGLWSHYYGIESLNHKAAKTVGKGLHPDKLKQGLLDVKEYFGSKYRSTYSMIIGLPYETEETFSQGMNWLTDNMPNESVMAFPLYLADHDHKSSKSEFDRTWRDSGDFHSQQVTNEMVGASKKDLPEVIREYVWRNYDQSDAVKWSHDSFNWWTANKLWAEVLLSKHMAGKGILNWNLYNFVSSGYSTWDDVLSVKNNDYDQEKLKNLTEQHIDEYKWKKLSL